MTLGEGFPSRSLLVTQFTEFTTEWPKNATSYPLKILGDTASAVGNYLDSAGMFGPAEIRSISSVDFRDGKVTRQVDYWDGRRNPDDVPGLDDQYPYDLGLDTVGEQAAPKINNTAHQLNAALSAGDAHAAMVLFVYNAILDITLRTKEEGQPAIGRYLQRALAHLPYGPGTAVHHVLGSDQGGGYEWQTDDQPVRNGITALELDRNGLITQFTRFGMGLGRKTRR